MSGKYAGNQHKAHDCPYCWRVLYSKGAQTSHINREHWDEKEGEQHEHDWVIAHADVRYRDEYLNEFVIDFYRCECGAGYRKQTPKELSNAA